jgi:hypothetical protein
MAAWSEAYAASEVGIFQTPQVYARADMAADAASTRPRVPGWFAHSPVQLALAAGVRDACQCPARPDNLKITSAADWQLAHHLVHLLA